MKKILLTAILLISIFGIWSRNFSYNPEKSAVYVTDNALSKSHTCCAWFVMRAMQAGGCPIGIYPAYYYSKVLPKYGFKVIDTKNYKKGDIIVFPAIKNHIFGHIAIWNGEQWVSDFKQKSMFPASGYRFTKYKIFRYEKSL